jgi:hypothetical protein
MHLLAVHSYPIANVWAVMRHHDCRVWMFPINEFSLIGCCCLAGQRRSGAMLTWLLLLVPVFIAAAAAAAAPSGGEGRAALPPADVCGAAGHQPQGSSRAAGSRKGWGPAAV